MLVVPKIATNHLSSPLQYIYFGLLPRTLPPHSLHFSFIFPIIPFSETESIWSFNRSALHPFISLYLSPSIRNTMTDSADSSLSYKPGKLRRSPGMWDLRLDSQTSDTLPASVSSIPMEKVCLITEVAGESLVSPVPAYKRCSKRKDSDSK